MIASKIKARNYLEIGVYDPSHNFDKIQVEYKIGVDPDNLVKEPATGQLLRITSDKFWALAPQIFKPDIDLTWIDGLHYEDQAIRDIQGAWEITRPGGVIALHDTNPPTEATTCIPRGKQREWCGDVYKAIVRLWLYDVQAVYYFTADFDYGVTIIRKVNSGDRPLFIDRDISWSEFDSQRKKLLHLESLEDVIETINGWT